MLEEIRFHGRGGQGAVTAAELLAVTAVEEGYFAKSFPFFGVERRGAPVQAFCRISDREIKINQYIYNPNIVVVLDPSLLESIDVCFGMKKQGTVILNGKPKHTYCLKANKVKVVNATAIAMKHIGKPFVNTAMLGAFARVTGLVSLSSLESAIRERFPEKIGEKNIAAIRESYNKVKK